MDLLDLHLELFLKEAPFVTELYIEQSYTVIKVFSKHGHWKNAFLSGSSSGTSFFYLDPKHLDPLKHLNVF